MGQNKKNWWKEKIGGKKTKSAQPHMERHHAETSAIRY